MLQDLQFAFYCASRPSLAITGLPTTAPLQILHSHLQTFEGLIAYQRSHVNGEVYAMFESQEAAVTCWEQTWDLEVTGSSGPFWLRSYLAREPKWLQDEEQLSFAQPAGVRVWLKNELDPTSSSFDPAPAFARDRTHTTRWAEANPFKANKIVRAPVTPAPPTNGAPPSVLPSTNFPSQTNQVITSFEPSLPVPATSPPPQTGQPQPSRALPSSPPPESRGPAQSQQTPQPPHLARPPSPPAPSPYAAPPPPVQLQPSSQQSAPPPPGPGGPPPASAPSEPTRGTPSSAFRSAFSLPLPISPMNDEPHPSNFVQPPPPNLPQTTVTSTDETAPYFALPPKDGISRFKSTFKPLEPVWEEPNHPILSQKITDGPLLPSAHPTMAPLGVAGLENSLSKTMEVAAHRIESRRADKDETLEQEDHGIRASTSSATRSPEDPMPHSEDRDHSRPSRSHRRDPSSSTSSIHQPSSSSRRQYSSSRHHSSSSSSFSSHHLSSSSSRRHAPTSSTREASTSQPRSFSPRYDRKRSRSPSPAPLDERRRKSGPRSPPPSHNHDSEFRSPTPRRRHSPPVTSHSYSPIREQLPSTSHNDSSLHLEKRQYHSSRLPDALQESRFSRENWRRPVIKWVSTFTSGREGYGYYVMRLKDDGRWGEEGRVDDFTWKVFPQSLLDDLDEIQVRISAKGDTEVLFLMSSLEKKSILSRFTTKIQRDADLWREPWERGKK